VYISIAFTANEKSQYQKKFCHEKEMAAKKLREKMFLLGQQADRYHL
jgi:hypothetical protein